MSDLQDYILENLETYKDLFDNAHDLIHLLHPNGDVIYINKSWSKVLGYSLEEIKGKSIYSIVEEKERERFVSYRKDIISGIDGTREIILPFRSKSGATVYLEGFVSSKIVDNEPLYTRGIFRDVTRRLNNEAKLQSVNMQLKERERNVQQLLFYAPDAVVVIDHQSKVSYWNPKAEQVFGWSAEEVTGRSLTDLIIPPQHRLAHEQGMKRYLKTGETHVLNKTLEITALNRAGREFYVSLTISSTTQNGEGAFIAFIRDIDEQKINALELEQKKKQLEVSNAELERFAHVASHDMKEPIRKILVYAEQIHDDDQNVLSETSKAFLAKVQNAASRLEQMVQGVLTYSSIQASQPAFEDVDLNVIVRNVIEDLELVIRTTQAKISFFSLPVIKGIPVLLHQLFYNLIQNSLKFSKKGIALLIQIRSDVVSGESLQSSPANAAMLYHKIEVEDNGIGFEQEYAEEIFNTFYRLYSKDKFEGTGLGLSLCRSIVEKHRGRISASGEPDKGATFTILFPAEQG